MILGHQTLNFGLRVRVTLIILLRVWSLLLKMRFLVGWKLTLNYALYSSLLFTHHWNKYFVPMSHVQQFGNRPNYCTPIILNVFMVFVKISSILFLPNVLMVQWLNIWVKFMLFTTSMNYCFLPPLSSRTRVTIKVVHVVSLTWTFRWFLTCSWSDFGIPSYAYLYFHLFHPFVFVR